MTAIASKACLHGKGGQCTLETRKQHFKRRSVVAPALPLRLDHSTAEAHSRPHVIRSEFASCCASSGSNSEPVLLTTSASCASESPSVSPMSLSSVCSCVVTREGIHPVAPLDNMCCLRRPWPGPSCIQQRNFSLVHLFAFASAFSVSTCMCECMCVLLVRVQHAWEIHQTPAMSVQEPTTVSLSTLVTMSANVRTLQGLLHNYRWQFAKTL